MTTEGSVPGGVPATGAGPVVDLIAADPSPRIRSAYSEFLDVALAAPRVHRTIEERWIEEPGTLHGGHWELVGGA
jgi:hypothetical protein